MNGVTGQALALAQEAADVLAARPPVELVPMVSVAAGLPPIEILPPQCGLARIKYAFTPGDTQLNPVWTVNEHDPLPCWVTGVGIVHAPYGPVMFVVPVAAGPPGLPGVHVDRPGRKVEVTIPWPVRITVS